MATYLERSITRSSRLDAEMKYAVDAEVTMFIALSGAILYCGGKDDQTLTSLSATLVIARDLKRPLAKWIFSFFPEHNRLSAKICNHNKDNLRLVSISSIPSL